LQGNVWRFDLTAATGLGEEGEKIAILTNADGDLLPATTAPLLGVDPTSRKRYVMVGTGQVLSEADINSGTQQAFYAIADGTDGVGGFYTEATLPKGHAFPLQRKKEDGEGDFTRIDSFKSELDSSASPMGWVYDFAVASTGIAERMTVEGDVAIGMVAFSVSLPNGDPCALTGSSRVFAVRFATGKSALVGSGNELVEYVTDDNTTTELLFTKNGDSTTLTRGATDVSEVPVDPGLSGFRSLSWREISTVD
jgi:type IV pilus assembly protein PilY1